MQHHTPPTHRHMAQITNSWMYLRSSDSMYLGWYLPRTRRRSEPGVGGEDSGEARPPEQDAKPPNARLEGAWNVQEVQCLHLPSLSALQRTVNGASGTQLSKEERKHVVRVALHAQTDLLKVRPPVGEGKAVRERCRVSRASKPAIAAARATHAVRVVPTRDTAGGLSFLRSLQQRGGACGE